MVPVPINSFLPPSVEGASFLPPSVEGASHPLCRGL